MTAAAPLVLRFPGGLDPRWRNASTGPGALLATANGLRFLNLPSPGNSYANAQLDDYRGIPRAAFAWRPPLRLTVRARFSHRRGRLSGTAGFGFWNDPFRLTGLRPPTRPQALWFFYAGPDSHIPLALDRPAWGWNASLLDTRTIRFLLSAPALALAAPALRAPRLYRRLWPLAQRAAAVSQAAVPGDMRDWRLYTIDWQTQDVRFFLDGAPLAQTSHAPAGPLGLVLWLDNQFLQLTPWGRPRWGCTAKRETQWMEIDWLAVEERGGCAAA